MAEPSQYVRVKRTVILVATKTTKKYKKGRRVSQAYALRYPHLVRKTQWLVFEERPLKYDRVLRHQTYRKWRVASKVRLTQFEYIIKLKKVTNRSLTESFSRGRVYSKIWENDQGSVRVTVNGMVKGRRVKEVIHIGYLKALWTRKHNGYEHFKAFLIDKVLSALRQKGLRISNMKESAGRIQELKKRVRTIEGNLDIVPDWMRGSETNALNAVKRRLADQRRTRQLEGATIRIEKLVP